MSLPTRQIGGHKVCLRPNAFTFLATRVADILPDRQAAINNPRVSEEAKEHSRQAIEELEQDPETQETREGYKEDKDPVRVNAGYKATLKSTYPANVWHAQVY